MLLNTKIVIAILIIFYLIAIIRNIKNGKLQLSFSIFSILILVFMIIGLGIPSLYENISKMLGFEVTSNMLFLLAIFLILYLILRIMIILSSEYKKNVSLIQEVSILKEKLDKIEKKLDNNKN